MKIAGSGAGSGSVRRRYGSPDPDPYQNVTGPQHWSKDSSLLSLSGGTDLRIRIHTKMSQVRITGQKIASFCPLPTLTCAEIICIITGTLFGVYGKRSLVPYAKNLRRNVANT
jgi:hypothetical protein